MGAACRKTAVWNFSLGEKVFDTLELQFESQLHLLRVLNCHSDRPAKGLKEKSISKEELMSDTRLSAVTPTAFSFMRHDSVGHEIFSSLK